jgi:formate dehydrogenase subunit gamma
MNGGEKAWYWIIATVGIAVCVTGLILDFPLFGQTRAAMQTANVIHDLCAVIWIAAALGHMYIGTLGTEGALEAMTRGTVSAEWAKQHHSVWYEKTARATGSSASRSKGRESPRTTT